MLHTAKAYFKNRIFYTPHFVDQKLFLNLKYFYPLIFICIYTFIITMGDSIMSYASPVYIEGKLGSSFLMGVIYASSSFIGLISDILFGSKLRKKGYNYSLLYAGIIGVTFPIILFLLPGKTPTFLIAMASWGIYYEYKRFGTFNFIPCYLSKEHHGISWGLINTFGALATTVSPIIASKAFEKSNTYPFLISIPFYIFSIIFLMLFMKFVKSKNTNKCLEQEQKHSNIIEVKRTANFWKLLTKTMWPILLFIFLLAFIDATFWSVGTVLSEQMKSSGNGLLLFLYSLPTIFLGIFSSKFGKPFGKKRTSFFCGLIGGFILSFYLVFNSFYFLLPLTFLSSFFISISWPEIEAVFEDFVSRSKIAGSEIISIEGGAINIGFIIGPIISSYLAGIFGNKNAIGFSGILLMISSVIAFSFVPRKIRLPQKSFDEIIPK